LVLHVLILRIASAGVSTSIPNWFGTTPKSRRLNVTMAIARPLAAASSTGNAAAALDAADIERRFLPLG